MNEVEKDFFNLYQKFIKSEPSFKTTISLLDFLRTIKSMITHKEIFNLNREIAFLDCLLVIAKFLRKEGIVAIKDKKYIEFLDEKLKDLFFIQPNTETIYEKVTKSLNLNDSSENLDSFLFENNLITQFDPHFTSTLDYSQCSCSISSAIKRTAEILNRVLLKSQNLIFLGDDDLVSILVKLVAPNLNVSVLDIDPRIIQILEDVSNRFNFQKGFQTYNLDLEKISKKHNPLQNQYSIIHLDPPYEPKPLKMFLNRAFLLANPNYYQIFLHGRYNLECLNVLNKSVFERSANYSMIFKNFNSYPYHTMDNIFLRYIQFGIHKYLQTDPTKEEMRQLITYSDLYLIEKGFVFT